MIDHLHVQSKKVKMKKGWMEMQGGEEKKKKEKKRCVQHFESGHGCPHEHHLWRWWDGGQRDRA